MNGATKHTEPHARRFALPEVILGGQDGLVNVLGVILGVAAATHSAQIVIVAGLAATFAESISMAAVAYTSKLAAADHYTAAYEEELREIDDHPDEEKEETRTIYREYGFTPDEIELIVAKVATHKPEWAKLMVEQELKLSAVRRDDALQNGVIVGVSAVIGSLIPLAPFFFIPIRAAIAVSLAISALTLFAIGFYKAEITLRRNLVREGVQMAVIGIVSALTAYFVGLMLHVQ